MQPLLGGPRAGLADGAVREVLINPRVESGFGGDLLDSNDEVIKPLEGVLLDATVARANYSNVHGTCSVVLTEELSWGVQRVRLWETLDGIRFYRGVYVLTTPDRVAVDADVTTWDVKGFDKLYLLQGTVGDTHTARKGSGVLAEVRRALALSGVGGAIALDPRREDAVLQRNMTWPLVPTEGGDATPATWLRIVNELLDTISYQGLWVDEVGAFRSAPYVNPKQRPAEYVLDAGDIQEGIVGAERTETLDRWSIPNRWRFLLQGSRTPPREGAGQVTLVNQSEGPTSIDALGRTVTLVEFVEAQSQADLVSQAERRRTADTTLAGTISLTLTGPFPILGHFDRITYRDPALGGERATQVRSWEQSLSSGVPRLVLEDL